MGVTAEREAWGEKFESVRRWFTYIASDKTGSESTKDLYLLALERWCTFISKTPDEIIADRDSGLQKTEFAQKHRHEDLLRQAFNAMEASGYVRASCGAYLAPPVEEQAKLYLTAYPMLRCLG